MASKDNNKLIDQIHHVESTVPKNKHSLLKWNGWGYSDSKFVVDTKKKVLHFTGKRYPIGSSELPHFTSWVIETFHLDLEKMRPSNPLPVDLPEPKLNQEFVDSLKRKKSVRDWTISVDPIDRLVRCHGHTLHDIWHLREGTFTRIPDMIIWPEHHNAVVELVRLAQLHNVVLIPFGGGTSVSGAVNCPSDETRSIAIIDTTQMNRILWIDRSNLSCRCEAGILGQDLERELQKLGFTVGHEPDSYEFSSLGGWVATRASGMKKNVYGNIEDLVVHVKMVTPVGVLQKNSDAPRISCGPDFNHIILGSEGTLGIVTEVTLKIRPLPKVRKYGSIVFPDFESGVALMRDVAKERCQPASIRLMDNEQFKFGQALRPDSGWLSSCMDIVKKRYLTTIKGLDLNTICVATLLFEGSEEQVKAQESQIYSLASKHGGIAAGEKNGLRGYMLTFVIAYIRDVGLDYGVVSESFETSVPWDKTINLCKNVKHSISTSCKELGIRYFLISHRVTQTYDAGCCVYFYFGFNFVDIDEVEITPHSSKDPVALFELIETQARDEILRCGGSLSHHHGVGKIRKRWYQDQVTPLGEQLYLETKRALDPKGIFAAGNLVEERIQSKL